MKMSLAILRFNFPRAARVVGSGLGAVAGTPMFVPFLARSLLMLKRSIDMNDQMETRSRAGGASNKKCVIAPTVRRYDLLQLCVLFLLGQMKNAD
jgi:hypothetical protein